MSAASGERFSYSRASREIKANPSLRSFLKSARELSQDIEASDSDKETVVFAATSLRLVLFEWRANPAENKDANTWLDKLDKRLKATEFVSPERHQVRLGVWKTTTRHTPNPLPEALRAIESSHIGVEGPVVTRATSIVDSTKQDYKNLGTELSLVIDDQSSVANALMLQSEEIHRASRKTAASSRLPKPDDDPRLALHIPFMQAYFAGENERNDFIELLSTDLPVHDLEIGPIEWHSATVSPFTD